jgi:hypothetical protein
MTHIVATPGDRRSLCGERDPWPRVWKPFVAMHVRGHGMVPCPECYRAAGYPRDDDAVAGGS